jgi:Tol biopolymer transport system component
MKAELFAPRIVSTGDFEHSSPVFSPDLTEIYWSTTHEDKNGETYLRPTYYMKQVNGVWSEPKIPSFGKDFKVCENPFIQPDGKRIYFHANKTLPEGHSFKLDLYYAERKGDDWSEPVKLTETINTPNYLEGMPSVSRNGTLYFVGYYAKSEDGFGLYYSKLVNGKYEKPALMEEKFNSLNADWTPYIAPDESYFIFCSFRDGGFGSGDLYICFKEKDGSWGKVINMGDKINTIANERFPNVTPDGKYFFFNSTRKIQGADPNSPGNGNGDIYWIDAKIIEELRPKN